MSACPDEGRLRAYLDNELVPADCARIRAHLESCAACQEYLDQARGESAQLALLLQPISTPEPHAAFQRFQETQRTHRSHATHARRLRARTTETSETTRSYPMPNAFRSWFAAHKRLAATLAVVVVLAGLLALPPVRALADQFLQIFRVQQVVFVPISEERIEQLEDLDFDGASLFVGEPEMINDPGEPQPVDSVAEGEAAVGYDLGEVGTFPTEASSTTVSVSEHATMQFQVNVETSRQLLEMLEIDDVTLPDELGDSPITVDLPPAAMIEYTGDDYTLRLAQGQSPEVALPEGLDLAQLGKAALRLLGMESQQAEAMSQQIDWSSTLLFPFPENIDSIRQVSIGDAQGLLTRNRHDGDSGWQLYWQDGTRFYVLHGEGDIGQEDMVLAAESVQ